MRRASMHRRIELPYILALAVLLMTAFGWGIGCSRRMLAPPLTSSGSEADTLVAGIALRPLPAGSGSITGIVRGADHGAPLAYANVIAERTSDGQQWGDGSDLGGHFAIPGLPPGSYQVRALYLGYEALERPVEVSAGRAVEIVFELPATAVVTPEEFSVQGESSTITTKETEFTQQIRPESLSDYAVDTVEDANPRQAGVVARAGELHVRGGRSGEINYQIDGVATAPAARKPTAGQGGSLCGGLGNSWMHDELWIIQKYDPLAWQQGSNNREVAQWPPVQTDVPGTGALLAQLDDASGQVPMPLEHTDVRAQVAGFVASVRVTQQYQNPFDRKIEAEYIFPLPHDGAVDEFVMTVGRRRIRGIIREREEAQQLYAQARAQGHVAALMTQERPNVFTQRVANIEPGHRIDVELHYVHPVAHVDGWYEFVFPMVVGPRFNPPGMRDGIAAVSRGSTASPAQTTTVEYLAPLERSGHDIALRVEVDPGTTVEEIRCASHQIVTRQQGRQRTVVSLRHLDSVPNKDFVLRYRVAGRKLKPALITHRDERGGYFALMLHPPAELTRLERAPVEFVFVLDCSGSMSGVPIAQAKRAVRSALARLQPDDTFQIIRFSNSASALGPLPLPATEQNLRRGGEYLASLAGEGGTMMIEGIKAALDFPPDPHRTRLVSFLTDGFIGNEREILCEMQQRLGEARLFSFGVGSSVNRYLLEGMARLGRGAVAYIGPHENALEVVEAFYERVRHPALTDIQIDFGALGAHDVYPARIPDLFVGRPVVITGRFDGSETAVLRVSGRVGAQKHTLVMRADRGRSPSQHEGLASMWARRAIEELSDQAVSDDSAELPRQITQLALDHNLMSAYTSFLAVDAASWTGRDAPVLAPVAVPVPEGVLYETTVNQKGRQR